ncbi:MAG: S8 family serine peptidase [Candidatus Hodarchaeales archaeon]
MKWSLFKLRSHRILLIWSLIIIYSLVFGVIAPEKTLCSIDPDVQWNLIDIGAVKAWNYTQGMSNIVVAVIDSGVDFSHPDLMNQSWINPNEIPKNGLDDDNNGYVDDIVGWDFRDSDNDPSPGHEHGTFVAGLLAADDDDHICVGVAPNIRLMALRFLNDENRFGGGDWDMFIEALDYAVDNGARIIHLSIQADGIPPESFHTAIKRAYENEVIIVSVTGNNKDDVTYPGKYSEVIAVSATTRVREIAHFSSTGDQNEICAPGDGVNSTYPGKMEPQIGSGTSFAAPLVSGAISLILSLNSSLSIEMVRSILHETSTDLGASGKDPIFGYGLLNVSAALEKVVIEHNNGRIPIISDNIESSTSPTIITSSTISGPTLNNIIGILTLLILYKRRLKNSRKKIVQIMS